MEPLVIRSLAPAKIGWSVLLWGMAVFLFCRQPLHDAGLLVWVTGIFFVLMAVLFLLQAFDRRPVITIDSSGLTYRVSPSSYISFVSWKDVSKIRFVHYRSITRIQLELLDTKRWWLAHVGVRFPRASVSDEAPIEIPLMSLDVFTAEIRHYISENLPSKLSEN
jgi:hypothetical protein